MIILAVFVLAVFVLAIYVLFSLFLVAVGVALVSSPGRRTR